MAKNLIIRITCSLVFSVTALLPGLAQDQECGVLVSPRVEDGHAYYEVVATGFPADAEVQFSWWRREGTQTQNTQSVQPQDTQSADVAVTQECATVGLSPAVLQGRNLRSVIGKDIDGNYCRVSPGVWELRAQAGACFAQTKFTVPARATSGVPVGTWGGNNIRGRVTDTITTFDFFCALGTTTEPLVLNSIGAFDVQGTYRPVKTGISTTSFPAHYTGRVDDKTMTVTMTVENITETYTLTLGQQPEQMLPGCR